MSKTWYVTGTSRGFGRVWTEAALERGDKVAATARNTETLKDLVDRFGDAVLPITLDVTQRDASIAAIQSAHQHFGRLDVVMNNAGFGHFGFVEELSEADARAQMETNLFGALWTTQAAIPLLREQGGGHIVQVSSMGGLVAFPSMGIYNASKWALEGLTEALAQEVAAFNIKTTLVEPGAYATDWRGASAAHSKPNPLYQGTREFITDLLAAPDYGNHISGTVGAVLALVDAEQPPRRLLLSSGALDNVRTVYEARLQTWRDWEAVTRGADATRKDDER